MCKWYGCCLIILVVLSLALEFESPHRRRATAGRDLYLTRLQSFVYMQLKQDSQTRIQVYCEDSETKMEQMAPDELMSDLELLNTA